MSIVVPRGFRLAGVSCGLKQDATREDLTLIVSEVPSVAAGVYTQNAVYAAPVAIDRLRTPSSRIRLVVANSGNANACTGERGMRDALQMAASAAAGCQAEPDQALVLSTGVIGQFLPMERIERGIRQAYTRLGDDGKAFLAAARGILTTDNGPKIDGRTLELNGQTIRLAGMAKGAGMIGPRMATMLGVLLTDAALTEQDAQALLLEAVEHSFHCISVDGHTSTNDTVLLLASGAAGGPPVSGAELAAFQDVLTEQCIALARQIPDDGEGASHRITIDVHGARSRTDARRVAQAVAHSPLVKTAIAGADPNWGRIVSAAGYSGAEFEPDALRLRVNGVCLYQAGEPADFDAAAVSRSIRDHRETHLQIELGAGESQLRFWTSDLTVAYVRFNSEYHT